jgi:hypothetical protein
MADSLPLTEDEIDDILYCARANELEELRECVNITTKRFDTEPWKVISEAVDPNTGNCALHYAAANGLLGMPYLHSIQTKKKEELGCTLFSCLHFGLFR